MNHPFKVYLGRTRSKPTLAVYLNGFDWACGWYWGGGGVATADIWAHFDGCFLNPIDERGHPLGNFVSPWKNLKNGCSVWEDLGTFLNFPQFTPKEWWRIKDLYKQFYIYQKAAEAFQHGGNCNSDNRNPAEINPIYAEAINRHIEMVIIPEIKKALRVTS
jgi:hypothetical protein